MVVERIISRHVAIENLKKYIGRSLRELAVENNITVFKDGKINKGWKGHTLNVLAGLGNDNIQAPNGLGFELKSVAFKMKNGIYIPKETMAITMLNPKQLIETSFYESHCWEKLKALVICSCTWTKRFEEDSILLSISSFDFLDDNQIIKEIEEDYEFLRNKLVKSGYESLTGKDGKWIQTRTKGPGHGSISRAFYARKELVHEIYKQGINHI